MKKIMILPLVFCLIFSLMACSKKSSYPSANDVKNDIMGEMVWGEYTRDGKSPITEVKEISVMDVNDMKSTLAKLEVVGHVVYVTENGYEYDGNYEASYGWVDNKGWVFYRYNDRFDQVLW